MALLAFIAGTTLFASQKKYLDCVFSSIFSVKVKI